MFLQIFKEAKVLWIVTRMNRMSPDDLARDSNECSYALWRQTSDFDLGIDVVEGHKILLVSCSFFFRPVFDEVLQGCED